MSSINERDAMLFFDFRYQGVRCREYTKLKDTPANRKRMRKVLDKMEQEMVAGTFCYTNHFPGSKLARKLSDCSISTSHLDSPIVKSDSTTPLFSTFTNEWFTQSLPMWRQSTAETIRSTLDSHLIPAFGEHCVGDIRRADILEFRAELAKHKGRCGNRTLAPKTLNRVIQILGQIMAEAAERYGFANPVERIKRLKQRRVDIHPFSLAEVQQLIAAIREDYQPYMVVRFFTGMRTGEINGLKWRYVDFERNQILIRETVLRGRVEYTKTDGSQREITLSGPVREALLMQRSRTGDREYVFCTTSGAPLDTDNFTNRVWYPLLRHLGLEKRRPYQTRHTCATLWLGAGENPEWVARQLGHVNTMMLFQVYSRFIPNLTRQDGSAFDQLIKASLPASAFATA